MDQVSTNFCLNRWFTVEVGATEMLFIEFLPEAVPVLNFLPQRCSG